MVRSRSAFSLVEVVLAVALFGLCSVALITALTHGAAGAARASEVQLASGIAARLMDRMVAPGYAGLVAFPRASGPLELPTLDGAAGSEALDADGIAYHAAYQLSLVRDGLVRVVLELTWDRAGTIGAREPGRFTVMRYVADPTRALAAR